MTIIIGALAGAIVGASTALPIAWTAGIGAVMGWHVRIADNAARHQTPRPDAPTAPGFLAALTILGLILALAAAGLGAGL